MSDAAKDTGWTTVPNPDQPDRCPSIDPHDTLQCGRRIHEDDQCQFGGIGWKKGTPRLTSQYAFDCFVCPARLETDDIQQVIAFSERHKNCGDQDV